MKFLSFEKETFSKHSTDCEWPLSENFGTQCKRQVGKGGRYGKLLGAEPSEIIYIYFFFKEGFNIFYFPNFQKFFGN